MLSFVAVFHILVAVLLVVLVLLQDSKGGALGMGGGGGGSQSLFGATGASNFLVKTTRWLAVLFAATCISLTYFSSHKDTSVTDDYVPAAAPAKPAAPADATAPAADGKAAPAQSAAPAKPAEPKK
jgi:preprotein translocase subunit SecG